MRSANSISHRYNTMMTIILLLHETRQYDITNNRAGASKIDANSKLRALSYQSTNKLPQRQRAAGTWHSSAKSRKIAMQIPQDP